MKKKLFIVFAFAIMFVMIFTVVSFADSVHNENTVNYTQTVTLDDGTVLPLYDEDKDALIWYISGTGQDGKKNLHFNQISRFAGKMVDKILERSYCAFNRA